jgi:hypothetical protein
MLLDAKTRYMLMIYVSKKHDSAEVITICILFQQYIPPTLSEKQPDVLRVRIPFSTLDEVAQR